MWPNTTLRGALLWIKGAGGSAEENSQGIDIDASGNVFITGSYQGSVSFDGISVNSGNGINAVFLAKYDTNGAIQWVRRGTNSNSFTNFIGDIGHDVKVDAAGNIYITGQKTAVMNFGAATVSNPNGFSVGSFIVKYDTNGNPLFGIPINPTNVSYQPAKLDIVNNELYVLYINYGNSYAITVRKYSLTGSLITTYTPFTSGGVFQESDEIDFVVGKNGNITVIAEFQSSVSVGGNALFSSGSFASSDIFVTQRSSNSTFNWVKQLSGGSADKEGGIEIDTADNIYITGYFNRLY